LKVKLLLVGKTREKHWLEGIHQYEVRLKNYANFERIEIPDIKSRSNLSFEEIKKKEGELILGKLSKSAQLVLLDNNGKQYSSMEFSKFLQGKMLASTKELFFVVGGAYGFSEAVYNRAQQKFSLSKMTFSHQIVRVIFLEQLYRAYSILNNSPYHHE